jgi:hypothetical protein
MATKKCKAAAPQEADSEDLQRRLLDTLKNSTPVPLLNETEPVTTAAGLVTLIDELRKYFTHWRKSNGRPVDERVLQHLLASEWKPGEVRDEDHATGFPVVAWDKLSDAKDILRQSGNAKDRLRLLLAWAQAAARPETAGAATPLATIAAKLSPSDLACKHGVPLKALRGRLDRWRYEHDAGYSQVANRKQNEPQFLYDESAVMPIIESLKGKTG